MKKYQIIYADPPWSYRSGKVQGAAQNHYQTMSDEQLYQLPVADLTAEDCALFLWCTFPKLPEAIKLISAWGFSFYRQKTDFCITSCPPAKSHKKSISGFILFYPDKGNRLKGNSPSTY